MCSSCKNRKIKCDKGRPCIACLKAGIAELCTYDSNWLPSVKKKEKKPSSQIKFSDYVHSARVPMAVVTVQKEALSSVFPGPSVDANNEQELLLLQLLEEMVLIKKKELLDLQKQLKSLNTQQKSSGPFDLLAKLPVVDSTGTYVYFGEPLMVYIGESRYQAWNQLGTSLRNTPVHDPNFPGTIPNNIYGGVDDFDPRSFKIPATNLVKNELIGINPYESADDTLEVTCDEPIGNDSVTCHNPMSWEGLVRRDHWMRVLRQYTLAQKHEENLRLAEKYNSAQSSPTFASSNSELGESNATSLNDTPATSVDEFATTISKEQFEEKQFNDEADSFPYSLQERVIPRFNRNSISLGMNQFNSNVSGDFKLIEQLLILMPKIRVTWTLVNRYFQILYPYAPFLDEYDFRRNLARILGPESYQDTYFTKLNMERRSDLAWLSILFVILRLSYLTLLSNRSSINKAKLNNNDGSSKAMNQKYLLSHPVKVNVIDVAHLCLNQFQTTQKITLPVLQSALYLKIYHTLAPEDGDGVLGPSYQVLHGTLVHMAFSLGLNHEPSINPDASNLSSEEICKIEREHQLRRKIWGHLRTTDFCEANKVGSPPAINILYHDTKFPFIKAGNENVFDVEMDRAVTRFLALLEDFCIGPANQLLSLSLNIRRGIKLSEYTKYLNHIEFNSYKLLGRLPDYTLPVESKDVNYAFAKTTKCMISLYSRAFYMVVYFHLFSFYESKENNSLSFFYLKKVFSITIEEMVPSLLPLVFDTEACLGEGTEVFINPAIIDSLYRGNQIILIILIRLKYYLYVTSRSPEHKVQMESNLDYKDHFTRMEKLVSLLKRCSKTLLAAVKILSNKSYSAWVTVKCHTFLLKIVEGDDLYQKTSQNNVKLTQFTSTQIRELMSMCENGLKLLEKTVQSRTKNITLKDLLNNDQTNKEDDINPLPQKREETPNLAPVDNDVAEDSSSDYCPMMAHLSGDTADPFSNIFTELDSVDTQKVDSTWLKMLNGKQMKMNDPFEAELGPQVSGEASQAAVAKQPDARMLSFNEKQDEMFNNSYFDMFSDLPLNEVFSQNL